MDNERLETNEISLPEESRELFSLLQKRQNITIRDDHFDFGTILDALRQFKDGRYRFRMIDTGIFGASELEWIVSEGADLYTSDEVRTDVHELDFINGSARSGGAFVAYLVKGELDAETESALSLFDLINIGGSGVYLHLSNRKIKHDPSRIAQLAYTCRKGGSWLVYYHHGPLEESLVEAAESGAWIHISGHSLGEEENHFLLRDIVLSAQSQGANLILHWEKGVQFSILKDLALAGAVILFKSALFDYKSPLKVLEKGIRRKRLDFRSYYLYPTVLP